MHKPNQSGQSLFEMIMAVGLVAIIAVAIVSISTSSIRNSTFSQNKNLANRYAQEAVEWLKSEKEKGWEAFRGNVAAHPIPGFGQYSNICFNTLDWNRSVPCLDATKLDGTFFREGYFSCYTDFGTSPVNCADPDIDIIRVTLRVYWQDAQGTRDAQVTTIFTKWQPI